MKLTWTTEKRKLSDLKPFEGNPRQMDAKQAKELTKSLRKFNLVEIPAINTDNTILAGHQRITALKAVNEGVESEIDVRVPSRPLTPEEATEYLLRSNKNTGSWDWDMLAQMDKELLQEVGFDREEMEKWLGKNVEEDDFDVEKALAEDSETTIQAGDRWQLGEHILMCGDATQDIRKLVGEETIDLLLTDPPYGVNYDGMGTREKIANDNIANYREWFGSWLKDIPWSTYNAAYIFMSGKELHNLRLAIDDVGMYFSAYLVWIKNNAVFGRQDYANKHEWIAVAYAWKDRHKNYALDYKTTVLEYKRPSKSELHPTMKPIPLLADLMQNSSIQGHTILDLFGGSGSTLIAAEQLGRKCFMMELSPKYCQIIIQRWEKYTDKKSVKL